MQERYEKGDEFTKTQKNEKTSIQIPKKIYNRE